MIITGLKIIFGQRFSWNGIIIFFKLRCQIIVFHYVFTKYIWMKPLKDKKAKTVLDGFIGIVNESNRTSYMLINNFTTSLCKNS